ncbi:MAG: biopolymer transporter ExbD [Candidatus Stahlbacteria bacterium]|nr:biopolymer transporter ExbD [Candidatus Stahlbacteria bacterium]
MSVNLFAGHSAMRKRKLMAEINVTNLVDVALTLLTTFILSAPLLKAGMDVSLPQTAAAKFIEKDGITVTIKKNKEIFIEKTKVDVSAFDDKFKQIVTSKSTKMVYLNADKDVDYGFVIEILGKIKLTGIENVGLTAEFK